LRAKQSVMGVTGDTADSWLYGAREQLLVKWARWVVNRSGVASCGALRHVAPLDFQQFHFWFTLE